MKDQTTEQKQTRLCRVDVAHWQTECRSARVRRLAGFFIPLLCYQGPLTHNTCCRRCRFQVRVVPVCSSASTQILLAPAPGAQRGTHIHHAFVSRFILSPFCSDDAQKYISKLHTETRITRDGAAAEPTQKKACAGAGAKVMRRAIYVDQPAYHC